MRAAHAWVITQHLNAICCLEMDLSEMIAPPGKRVLLLVLDGVSKQDSLPLPDGGGPLELLRFLSRRSGKLRWDLKPVWISIDTRLNVTVPTSITAGKSYLEC